MKTILVKISNPQQEKVLTEFLEQHHYEFMAPDGENELETINRLLDIAEEEITEKKIPHAPISYGRNQIQVWIMK